VLTASHCFLVRTPHSTVGHGESLHWGKLQDIDGIREVKLDRGAWAVAGEPRFPVTRGGTRYGAALRFSSCPREAGRISESVLGRRIQIKKVTTHPMFYWGVPSNREIDVCLVELMSDFDLSNTNFGTVRMNTDAALAGPTSDTGRYASVAGYVCSSLSCNIASYCLLQPHPLWFTASSGGGLSMRDSRRTPEC